MSQHKLLQKQLRKYVPEHLLHSPELSHFFKAVDDSYYAFDRDKELAERAFKISEEEYITINEQLKFEVFVKQKSLEKLKEIIVVLSGKDLDEGSNDLLSIATTINNEITQRKNAEKTLTSLITNMQSGVLLEDEHRKIVFTNSLFCKLFEIEASPEMMIGADCVKGVEESKFLFENPALFVQGVNKILAEQKQITGEIVKLANGKILERDYIPIFLEQEYKGHLWTYTDVTEKIKAQEIIRTTLEKLGDNVWEFDYTCNKVRFSKPDIDIIGYSEKNKEEATRLWAKHIHPDDKYMVDSLYEKYTKEGEESHNLEYRLIARDGSIHWVLDRGFIVERSSDGRPLKSVGTHTEITKIKETEQALRESEKSFRLLAENIPGAMFKYHVKEETGFFTYLSPHLEQRIGISEPQMQRFNAIIHPEDRKREAELRKKARETRGSYHFEGRFVVPGKNTLWLCITSTFTHTMHDGTLVFTGVISNTTKEKEAELALQIREEKYRNIIANMNLGLMEVDNNDVIRYVNNSFCEMSGYNEEELLGRTAEDLFVKGDYIQIMDEKNELRKLGRSDAYEVMVQNKHGQKKWWLISGAPRYNDAGDLVGSLGIHLDITDQKSLQQDLVYARQQAEESARSKQVFLTNMSHEIRTPMNAIIGMSNQLSKTSLSEKQRMYLGTIHTAADNLLMIINDILDLSKMEAGKLHIESIGFNLKNVITRSLQVIQHKAEEKGLDIGLVYFDKAVEEILIGDPYRLSQILLNLLSNAVKFTEKGYIHMRCFLTDTNSSRQTVRIEVEDTGIGMEEEFIEKMFGTAFNQEYNSVSRKYGGTGLGVHICKQLTELMGGTIDVHSRKGAGTKMVIQLSYNIGTKADTVTEEQTALDLTRLRGKKILVADDNDMNRLLISVLFQDYGSTIIEAKNGREAIDILQREKIDIVLMDIQMPEMNGIQAIGVIRNELKSNIPVIALTANAIKSDCESYLQSGMNSYVLKPINEDELLRTIIKYTDTGADVSEEILVSKTLPEKLYDLTKLLELSRGDNRFVVKMINLFTQQAPAMMHDIQTAAANGDAEVIAAMAHKLKPSVGNLCLSFLFENVKKIEQIALTGNLTEELTSLIEVTCADIQTVVSQLEEEVGSRAVA